jgi:hypothetical protein
MNKILQTAALYVFVPKLQAPEIPGFLLVDPVYVQ